MSIVKTGNAAETIAFHKGNATRVGQATPLQLQAVIGKLCRGQSDAVKASLVSWINEAEVNEDHRAVVAALVSWKECQGRQGPKAESLDLAAELVTVERRGNTYERARAGLYQLVAWADMVEKAHGEANFCAILDARDSCTLRTLLRKINVKDAEIYERFPETQKAKKADPESGSMSFGKPRKAKGKAMAATQAAPQGFDSIQLLEALNASGMEFGKAIEICKVGPTDALSLMEALNASGMDFEAALAIAKNLNS